MKIDIEERKAKTNELVAIIKEKRAKKENSDQEFNKLIELNIAYILKLAGKSQLSIDLDEKVNIAIWGVSEAIDSFDFEKEVNFSSYVGVYIKTKLLKENRIDMPGYNTYRKERKAIQSLEKQNNNNPSNEEIASEMGISEEVYQKYQGLMNPASLDSLILDDVSLVDCIRDDSPTPIDVFLGNEIIDVFNKVSISLLKNPPKRDTEVKRSVYILREHILSNKTFSDLACELKISKQRVKQLYDRTMITVRKKIAKEGYGKSK